MSEWTHPTLADLGETRDVRCRCGRVRRPSEMYDVRSLGVGTDYLGKCCIEDVFRREEADLLTFHRRAGAPKEWLDGYDAKLRRGPLLRHGLPQEIWGEMYADALENQVIQQVAEGLAPVDATWAGQLEVQAEIQAQAQAQVDGTPPAV